VLVVTPDLDGHLDALLRVRCFQPTCQQSGIAHQQILG